MGAALLTLMSCGGGDETVARLAGASHASISRKTLDHWMQALAGSDIRANLKTEGPAGLASEPADYERCFAAAKLVAPRSFFNQIRYDRVQVTEKCRELHEATKHQALSFLISSLRTSAEAAEHGIVASPTDVQHELAASRGPYPTEVDLRRYLRERHWSLSDLLYQLKLAVLARKLGSQPQQPLQLSAADPADASSRIGAHPSARITIVCAKGYMVPGCNAYRGPTPRSASAVLAQLTGKDLAGAR